MSKNDKITIYCPIDKTREVVQRSSALFCKNGTSIVEDFPPRQPLFFCCRCATFLTEKTFLSNQNGLCLSCGKKTSVFCLCHNCPTIAFDSSELETNQKFFIKEGIINELCPACLKKSGEVASLTHSCETLNLTFYISRESCPFCGKSFPPEELLVSQLKIFNEKFNRQSEQNELLLIQIKELQERQKNSADLQLKFINNEESLSNLKAQFEVFKQEFEDLKNENATEKKNSVRVTVIEKQLEDFRQIMETRSLDFKDFFVNLKAEISRHLIKLDSIFATLDKSFSANFEEAVNQNSEKDASGTDENYFLQNPQPESEPPFQPSIKKYADEEYETVVHENIAPLLAEIAEPVSSNLKGLVADILKQFSGMTALTHYPLIEGALKISNSSEQTVVFYHLQIEGKEFAIPASKSVQNESQFRQYASIYKAGTSKLNGKIEIIKPAEIHWDDTIKGYKCKKKGLISII